MYLILGGTILAAVVFSLARASSKNNALSRAVSHASKTGELDDLVQTIMDSPPDKRSARLDQALERLWQSYARQEAARLVKIAARHTDALILQYWIRQVIEVEPAIAEEVFTQEFLDRHFEPDTAAQCRKGCGCG